MADVVSLTRFSKYSFLFLSDLVNLDNHFISTLNINNLNFGFLKSFFTQLKFNSINII